MTDAGDINDDGFDDLFIGADAAGRTGGGAVVLGSDSQGPVMTNPEDPDLTVFSGETARGWWIVDSGENAGSGMGYSVSAVPAEEGRTATLLIGQWGDSRAIAFDSSMLTGAAGIDAPNTTLIDIAAMDAQSVRVLSGAGKDRAGRAVGIVEDFGDHRGPLMVAGADNISHNGYIAIAPVPERHELSSQPEDEGSGSPTAEPAPTPSAEPTSAPSAEPTSAPSAEPSHAATADPGRTPNVEPSQKAHEKSPEPAASSTEAVPKAEESNDQEHQRASRLPRTGVSAAAAMALGIGLIAVGVCAALMTRRNEK